MLTHATPFFTPFPEPESVFARDLETHTRLFLPLAALDLDALGTGLSGVVHFLAPVDPFDGLVGEANEAHHTEHCRPGWVAFQYTGDRCACLCDPEFFDLGALDAPLAETHPARQRMELERREGLAAFADEVHEAYQAAKAHFQTHGALHHRYAEPPYRDEDRLALLDALGGDSEARSCNWSAFDDRPLHRLSDTHVVPQTADGRDTIYVGELTMNHYLRQDDFHLCGTLLLFFDPSERVALSAFDWS